MTDHSEFPWGPQYEPGLLTPFGLIGWIAAAALLLALLLQLVNPAGRRRAAANLDDIHKVILAAARYALKQDEFGILKGADVLRRVIRSQLGGLLMAGGALGKQVKALGTAMGEESEEHGHGHGAHGAHGGGGHGNGHGAHGAHGASHGGGGHNEHTSASGHAAQAANVPGAVANTVQGHSITVNVGSDPAAGGHPPEGEEAPLSLEARLVAIRKGIREFEAWWSDKPARMAELRAAHDDLCNAKKLDPAIMALFEEKK